MKGARPRSSPTLQVTFDIKRPDDYLEPPSFYGLRENTTVTATVGGARWGARAGAKIMRAGEDGREGQGGRAGRCEARGQGEDVSHSKPGCTTFFIPQPRRALVALHRGKGLLNRRQNSPRRSI